MKDYKTAWNFLDNKTKKTFYFIVFLFIILSFLELLSVASIIPFTAAIFNPSSLSSIEVLKDFSSFLEKNQNILVPIFCLIFFILFLFKNLFSIFIYKFINFFVSNLKALVGKKLLTKFFNQDYLFFMTSKQGKLITLLSSETEILASNFFHAAMIFISEIFILIALFILIILTGNIKGILIILPLATLVYLFIKKINKKIKYWSNERVIISEDFSTLNQRIFLGIRDIYLSTKVDKVISSFFLLQKNQGDLDAKNSIVQMLPRSILEIIGLLVILSYILYFNYIELDTDLIISNLTFYFIIAYRSIPSFNKILIQYQRIKYAKNSIKNINSILSLSNKRTIELKDDNKFTFKEKIIFKNISFAYGKVNSIENVNLEVKKGELIGIYGESGSGKSTLLNLLTLLIRPNSGKVYIDKKIIEDSIEIKKFQTLITFISQDTFLIEDTIKNNIIFNSSSKIDNEQLKFAIDFAQVNKFVEDLPNGIDYMVGSHSRRISSGQKQRIAIARAIYSLKDIIIFDEATNALDEVNEKAIMSNIYGLRGKKTIIIVSHNKYNLNGCDKIFEARDKKIIQIK
jgi:ABC-type multidrug transport system fused ATPase/permease subunit